MLILYFLLIVLGIFIKKNKPLFIESFKPKIFDFGQQNNRSNGKDIAEFGNDLLQATVDKGLQAV